MSVQTTNKATSKSELVEKLLDEFHDPDDESIQATGDSRRKSDATNIRTRENRGFDIPAWDRSNFDHPTVPNCLTHSWDAPGNEDHGGTDWLCTAKPGLGKSTLANYLSARLMDINDEKVVWRGSTSRSEWLPLAPWTKLCLPENVDVRVLARSRDPREPEVELDSGVLEGNVVREVVRYSDPIDLNQNHLDEGQFHVVYPDPRMRQCQAIYEASDEKAYDSPSGDREALFHEEDPANHWWFAWILARIDHGPHHWTSFIADEIGDIAPQSVMKDSFGSYQKVQLLKDAWVDARKFGLSVFAFGHSEKDIHSMIRRKIRWRVQLRGSANPTTSNDVLGFSSIKMNHDLTSNMDVGEALLYSESNFDRFAWKDMPSPTDYKLKIKLE
jgi:hypothetical protein